MKTLLERIESIATAYVINADFTPEKAVDEVIKNVLAEPGVAELTKDDLIKTALNVARRTSLKCKACNGEGHVGANTCAQCGGDGKA